MSHALVLNATFEPLHIVTWQRAMQLLFQGKVEVIEESEREIKTVRLTIRAPAVLRLLRYVPLRSKKDIIHFSRTNIFLRDRNICQYCGIKTSRNHLTLDHVLPVVQGGKKCWENIVTACKNCNQKKGGRTPAEAGLRLIRKPSRPNWLPSTSLQIGVTFTPESWRIYLKIGQDKKLFDDEDLDPNDGST